MLSGSRRENQQQKQKAVVRMRDGFMARIPLLFYLFPLAFCATRYWTVFQPSHGMYLPVIVTLQVMSQ